MFTLCQPEGPEKGGLGPLGSLPTDVLRRRSYPVPDLMKAKGGQKHLLRTAAALTWTAAGPGFNGSGGRLIPHLSRMAGTSSHFSSSPCAQDPSVCSGPG